MTLKKTQKIKCPNCEIDFDGNFEFCPHCGQQNKKLNLHFKYFVYELIEGSFNLDSKIFTTLKLLIFYPGKMTKEFIAGKRKAYIPPVRLYLVMSLLFFTLLSLMNKDYFKVSDETQNKENQRMVFDEETVIMDVPGVIDTLTLVNKSQDTNEESKFRRILRRMSTREGKQEFNEKFPKYISVGMFILMPLTALIFFLLFRRNTYYIQHLVFVLHLQSAMYVLFMLFNLLEFFIDTEWVLRINMLSFLVLLVLWIKKFYAIKWLKTIWKTFLFLLLYGVLFIFFLAAVTVINIWLII